MCPEPTMSWKASDSANGGSRVVSGPLLWVEKILVSIRLIAWAAGSGIGASGQIPRTWRSSGEKKRNREIDQNVNSN